MSERDEWLMAQVALGHGDHLEPLVRRYASPLLTFLYWMCRDHKLSEDLFQEVFLRVWSKRGTYKFPLQFKPWLYAIAANCCRSALRSRRETNPGDDLPEPLAAGPSPIETAISAEQATLVAQSVDRLPIQRRQVVVLRVWQGLEYSEIAQALGLSEGTVRSHMHHGLAALRSSLEPKLRRSDEHA